MAEEKKQEGSPKGFLSGIKVPSLPSFGSPKPSSPAEPPASKPPAPTSAFTPTLAMQPKKSARAPAAPAGYVFKPVAKRISVLMPDLRKKLREAGMNEDPILFIQQSLIIAILLTIGLAAALAIILNLYGRLNAMVLVFSLPILLFISFIWQMQTPRARAMRRARIIDRDLVFAGRQMLIELKAGVPLFDAMLSISRDYGEVSREFAKICERVNAGVPADIALHEISESNPSISFKRVLLQLINSIRSGSDVAKGLESVLDQIAREQVTELKAYGQKLNPLGMFYMIFGIILPSLGIALAIILFSFMSVSVTMTMLYAVLILLILMQYMFITIIESQKPLYEF